MISTKPMSAAERRRMVQERCRISPGWRLIHALGSLQLALVLLATIAIACAVATFTESGFSAKIAQAYIYKAPWFMVWLGVLCVNLFAVTLTRLPWERKHLGFIITHYGIILLLIGAMVGLHTGFEGNVTLRKDQPPIARLTTNRSVIQLESPADSYLYLLPFDSEIARPSGEKPRVFPVPGTKLRVVADDHAPSLIRKPKVVPAENADAGPVVHLRLSSPVVGRDVEMPLALAGGDSAEEDFFGMAKVRLLRKFPPQAPPGKKETRMVFGKFAPVADPSAQASAVQIRLSEDGSKVGIFDPAGSGATYLREEIMKKPVTEAGVVVVVEDYWPEFAMEGGRPVSRSDQPNNPAILVRLGEQAVGDSQPSLELIAGPESARYRISRGGQAYAEGIARPGEPFSLGWADWRAEVVAASEKAVIAYDIMPGEASDQEPPTPGFRARLEGPDGARGPDRWVESGQITSLTDVKNVVRIGYGLETKSLPFTLRLLNFEVPRDEGTDTPSNFLATVEFKDSRTGETKTGVAQMNRPASFPGTLLANITGINYKFSQAEWNPRNLDETTLQVLYDPGWLFKWLGSLAICIGIAIQFYGKPKSS